MELIIHPAHTAHATARHCRRSAVFLRPFRHHGFRGDQKPGDRRRVLQGRPNNFGRVNDSLAGEDGSIVVGKILEKDQYAFGFDAQNGEYVNLVSKGIIDPTKVVRAALQNAASIAGLLITTEAMVAERPKKDSGAPTMPGGGMGGMGGMDY